VQQQKWRERGRGGNRQKSPPETHYESLLTSSSVKPKKAAARPPPTRTPQHTKPAANPTCCQSLTCLSGPSDPLELEQYYLGGTGRPLYSRIQHFALWTLRIMMGGARRLPAEVGATAFLLAGSPSPPCLTLCVSTCRSVSSSLSHTSKRQSLP